MFIPNSAEAGAEMNRRKVEMVCGLRVLLTSEKATKAKGELHSSRYQRPKDETGCERRMPIEEYEEYERWQLTNYGVSGNLLLAPS